MLGHFVLLGVIKVLDSANEEILWLCHVTLDIAAAGMLVRSHRLLTLALTCALVPQGLWIIDFVCGVTTGRHPLGFTTFLRDADLLMWVLMSHHFYLTPVLGVMVLRRPVLHDARILGLAIVLAIGLTTACRLTMPPERNVNASHVVPSFADDLGLTWINGLDTRSYLLILNGAIIGAILLPASILLRVTVQRKTPLPEGRGVCEVG